jgi:hypothetical protein
MNGYLDIFAASDEETRSCNNGGKLKRSSPFYSLHSFRIRGHYPFYWYFHYDLRNAAFYMFEEDSLAEDSKLLI